MSFEMNKHVSITEIKDVIKRRKKYFFGCFLVISIVSVLGAFILPKKYESYITILYEKKQALNPLLDWQRAVMSVGDDRIASFNEIVLSRTSIEILLDSLDWEPDLTLNETMDDLIEATKKKITTDLRGNDGFRITFTDADPYACQKAANVLCNIYTETSIKSDKQQADETVRFLETKVAELKEQYEQQQQKYLSSRQRGLSEQPIDEGGLHDMMGRYHEDLTLNQTTLEKQQRSISLLKMFQENLDNPGVLSQIAALSPQEGVLYLDSLKAVAVRYSQLLNRYTPRYPEVRSSRTDLANMLNKSIEVLQAKIDQTKAERSSLVSLRDRTQRDLSSSLNLSVAGSTMGSEYLRIKENYDGAKQKLDQARIAKELADRGASKYVILDPAQVPTKPTKPKKALIIGGGMALGFLVGIASMFVIEIYDPTIRRKQDIEIFNKPIIGYLP